jgi:hypothetical protein
LLEELALLLAIARDRSGRRVRPAAAAPTSGRNGKGDADAYCERCHPGADPHRWTPERVLDVIRDWRSPYRKLSACHDWSRMRVRRRRASEAGRLLRRETGSEEFSVGLGLPPLGVAGLVREEQCVSWPNRRRCAAADDPLSWWRARHPQAGTKLGRMSEFAPTLRVDEIAGGVRLSLGRFFSAEGLTLQEAADELVWKMLVTLMAFRSRGISGLGVVCRPDMGLVSFLSDLDSIAAAGGDIRERLFGPSGMAA